jgi:hypothetical protein
MAAVHDQTLASPQEGDPLRCQNSTGRGVNKTQYPPRRRQPPQPSLPLRGVDYCRRQHVSVFCLATHRSSRPLQRPGHPARRPPLRGRARKEGEACSHRSMTGIARGALHLSRPAPPDPSRKGGSWRESAASQREGQVGDGADAAFSTPSGVSGRFSRPRRLASPGYGSSPRRA